MHYNLLHGPEYASNFGNALKNKFRQGKEEKGRNLENW